MSDLRTQIKLVGEWAALQDKTFWVPLESIVHRISTTFDLAPAEAGELLADGLISGRISAIDTATGRATWIAQAIISNRVDWSAGLLLQSGLDPLPLAVHWSQIEAAAGRWAALQAIARDRVDQQQATPAVTVARRQTGPTAKIKIAVEAKMRAELDAGTITPEMLDDMKKIELPGRFGGSETTCFDVRKKLRKLRLTPTKPRPPTNSA